MQVFNRWLVNNSSRALVSVISFVKESSWLLPVLQHILDISKLRFFFCPTRKGVVPLYLKHRFRRGTLPDQIPRLVNRS